MPNQDPAKITASLKWQLTELCPPGVELELIEHHGGPGRAGAAGKPLYRSGGPGDPICLRPPAGLHPRRRLDPIVTTFHQQLKADALLLGWGQDDDNRHSPNEKFSLADFHRGIKASARFGKN